MWRSFGIAFVVVFYFHSALVAKASQDSDLQKIVADFTLEYPALHVPKIKLGYAETLAAIQDANGLSKQSAFFRKYKKRLAQIKRSRLTRETRYQFDLLNWETGLALERLAREKQFKRSHSKIPIGGIFQLPNAAEWYAYYVRRWTSVDIDIDWLFQFGKKEVKRVNAEIDKIQSSLGYAGKNTAFCAHLKSTQFIEKDEQALTQKLEKTRETVYKNLDSLFKETAIPVVDIKPIKDSNKDTPPGYYDENIFYYGFFENRFPLRSLEWLFIHEAVPGHHYQGSVAPQTGPLVGMFWYPGFGEGWAAYTENLGKELGLYLDSYQQLGKWEWDLVRSARVSMDVGINYYGWSKKQALRFWKKHIRCQDEISEREVDRIVRWPAQVLSYKVGEREMLRAKSLFQRSQGKQFDVREFHATVLKRGTMPLSVLRQVVSDALAGKP